MTKAKRSQLPAGPCSEVDDFSEDRLIRIHHARVDKSCIAHAAQNLFAVVALHALPRMEPARERIVAMRSFLLEVQ